MRGEGGTHRREEEGARLRRVSAPSAQGQEDEAAAAADVVGQLVCVYVRYVYNRQTEVSKGIVALARRIRARAKLVPARAALPARARRFAWATHGDSPGGRPRGDQCEHEGQLPPPRGRGTAEERWPFA